MILRRTGPRIIAIAQPTHAWLAGRLAEAWGNETFEMPRPRDDVICAAALHDIGWLDWEKAPRLDTATGFPQEFQNVPAEEHTRLWTSGVEDAAIYGDLVALFVSRHGDAIYEKTFDFATARPAAAEAVRAFTTDQSARQNKIISLAREMRDAGDLSAANLQLVKDVIVALDTMSLILCWGAEEEVSVRDVPCRTQTKTTLHMRRTDEQSWTVEPWPFTTPRLALRIEGKLLERASENQADLDSLLRSAPREILHFNLDQPDVALSNLAGSP